jgi:hypothetical protein
MPVHFIQVLRCRRQDKNAKKFIPKVLKYNSLDFSGVLDVRDVGLKLQALSELDINLCKLRYFTRSKLNDSMRLLLLTLCSQVSAM